MALIDVVRCEMPPGILIAKFPSSDLRLGSQLVVHPGQTAIFVKGGAICDEFESGTYTLKTDNIRSFGRASGGKCRNCRQNTQSGGERQQGEAALCTKPECRIPYLG